MRLFSSTCSRVDSADYLFFEQINYDSFQGYTNIVYESVKYNQVIRDIQDQADKKNIYLICDQDFKSTRASIDQSNQRKENRSMFKVKDISCSKFDSTC